MGWRPDPEDRAAWSAIGGVVTAAGVGAAVAWLAIAEPTTSNEPLWPVFAFGGLAVFGLYWAIAPLARWWPWRTGSEREPAPGEPRPDPQAVHVLATSRYAAGRLEAEAGMTPLERWLKGRIEEAERHQHERTVLDTPAWQKAMHKWEVQNVTELAADYPSLVAGYRGNPSGHLPGLGNEEAFYERQINWLRTTLARLSKGTEPKPSIESNPTRVELLGEQYRKGRALQRRLVVAAGTAETLEQAREIEDHARSDACKWGQGAWRVVAEHFSGYEREFFGDGHLALGATGFAIACQQEIERLGGSADSFLGRKLDFIGDLLKRYDV